MSSTSELKLCLKAESCILPVVLALFPGFSRSFCNRVSGGRCADLQSRILISLRKSFVFCCIIPLWNDYSVQHFPTRLQKMLPSLKLSGDDWVTQSTQVIIRPQARSTSRQSKKTRLVGSDNETDVLEHTHRHVHL